MSIDVTVSGLNTEVNVTREEVESIDPAFLLALRGLKGDKGDTGSAGANGQDGQDGADGFSPSAYVEKVGDTATITITDKDGTTTASISDGSGGGTGDYDELENRPQINSVTLTGDLSSSDIGVADAVHTHSYDDLTDKPTLFSGDYNDLSNKPTIPSGVEKSTTTPKMDGTASVGSETKFAAGDHVHPTDTSRVPTTRKVNGYTLNSDVIVIDKLDDAPSGGVTLRAYFNNENNTIETYDIYNTAAVIGLLNNANTIIAQTFVPNTAKGAASGVCPLDANSKVDSQYLPSYVDDVIEAYPVSGATALSAGWLSATSGGSALTPEAGKIYVLMADSGDYSANTQFRWGGTAYVKLNDGGVSSITNSEIDTIIAS